MLDLSLQLYKPVVLDTSPGWPGVSAPPIEVPGEPGAPDGGEDGHGDQAGGGVTDQAEDGVEEGEEGPESVHTAHVASELPHQEDQQAQHQADHQTVGEGDEDGRAGLHGAGEGEVAGEDEEDDREPEDGDDLEEADTEPGEASDLMVLGWGHGEQCYVTLALSSVCCPLHSLRWTIGNICCSAALLSLLPYTISSH